MKLFLRRNDFQIVSFDVDGVLSARPITIRSWYDYVVNEVALQYSMTREQMVSFLHSHGIGGDNSQNQGSLTKAMIDLGFSRDEWNAFKTEKFKFDCYLAQNPTLARALFKLRRYASLIVVSNNMNEAVARTLDAVGIPRSIFSYIATYDVPAGLKTETDKYQPFLTETETEFLDVVVLGDKFATDLEPVLDHGGSAILIEDYRETKDACRLLLGMIFSKMI